MLFLIALLADLPITTPPAPRDAGIPLQLEVGETVERDVGRAVGWFCDEPKFISAKMVTRDQRNYWIVTGVKAGETKCRIGPGYPETGGETFLFGVQVSPRKR